MARTTRLQVEHAREVQRLIAERRSAYEAQKARDEAELAAVAAEEARKQSLLEGERLALLREAAELRDYLPRGVIRDQADLDYVNAHLATMHVTQGGQQSAPPAAAAAAAGAGLQQQPTKGGAGGGGRGSGY
jgi:hypothetical protein